MAESVNDQVVFDAVLGVLAERGYAGATTRRLAGAAGVNEVTLFRRYGDKRSLVIAAIHSDIELLAADGLTATGDLEADLTRVVEYYSALYRHRHGLVATLVLEGARDPSVASIIREPLAAVTRIGELVAHYQRTGQMVEEPTDYAVQALLAPLLMTTVLRRITLDDRPTPDAHAVVQRFLAGHHVS